MKRHAWAWAPVLFGLALAGCEGGPAEDAAEEAGPVAAVAPSSDPATAAPDGATLRIYHDLTAFEWYRRGEPLAASGRAYEVAGNPVSASADDFRLAGEYQGVQYYVPAGDDAPFDAVYVPVFEGYWQPFVAPDPPPAMTD